MLLSRNPTKFYTNLDFARMFARGPNVMYSSIVDVSNWKA